MRKRNTILFLTGLVSYYVGIGIYDFILQGEDNPWRFIFALGLGLIVLGILYLITKTVKPEIIKENKNKK